MIPVDYAVLRLARRLLPERLVGWLRSRRLLLEPGLETRHPGRAVDRYAEHLERYQVELQGQRVMVLGYGGSFGVAIELLNRDARHVALVDPYTEPDPRINERYLSEAPEYVREVEGEIRPNPDRVTVYKRDVCSLVEGPEGEIDLILSSSVLEHVIELEPLVSCLHQLTAQGGAGLHIVDLRDHYFKYPFEMLCHSERVWRLLLEPPTRLNRMRLWEYEQLFDEVFPQSEIAILDSAPEKLAQVEHRVRPEFLSGDRMRDAAGKIAIFCKV